MCQIEHNKGNDVIAPSPGTVQDVIHGRWWSAPHCGIVLLVPHWPGYREGVSVHTTACVMRREGVAVHTTAWVTRSVMDK
jgi:hypothetical protein